MYPIILRLLLMISVTWPAHAMASAKGDESHCQQKALQPSGQNQSEPVSKSNTQTTKPCNPTGSQADY